MSNGFPVVFSFRVGWDGMTLPDFSTRTLFEIKQAILGFCEDA